MDRRAVLASFDQQVRRDPPPAPGVRLERAGPVLRLLSDDGWAGVVWSDLDAGTADEAIAAQVTRFVDLPHAWEWKHYSHDRPADLPQRLTRAGLVAGPTETLMVAPVAELDTDVDPPTGVVLRPVTDAASVAALVRVHDEVFGGDHARVGRALARGLAQRPVTVAAVLAVAGDTVVSSGRLELAPGTDFASLWGGGTLPAWRGRGVFRAVVAHRARLAAAAGYRYLQVDATSGSRPILQRLGFVDLAVTTPFDGPRRTGS